MDLKTFEKVNNRQIALTLVGFVFLVAFTYLATPSNLKDEYFSSSSLMFAVMGGMGIWMLGVRLTILLIKKGIVK
jgi:hypothetical protein